MSSMSLQQYTKEFGTILVLLLTMALYGWTAIPFTYWFSFLFTSAPKGFTLIVMYNIITGMIGSIAIPIIQQTANDDVAYTWSVYNNEFGRQACQMLDCSSPLYRQNLQCCGDDDDRIYTNHVLTEPGRQGVLWPTLFFAIQYGNWKLECDGDITGEDSDVIAEKSNVKTMNVQTTAVVVDDIKK
ncbi:hypothetical protein TELCIR_19677, partial [Teladorsagia circumcincta]